MESYLREWGVDGVFTITVDNASSNGAAISWIKKRFKTWSGLVLGGEYLHVRCAAHILNLVVSDGLKEMYDSIKHIRNAVRYVRSSPSRLQKFKECIKHENIQDKGLVCLDVSTRWNSTFLMLEAALKFKKAFYRMKIFDGGFMNYFLGSEEDNNHGPPNDYDWKQAEAFVQFLRTFYEATLSFSASLNVTSNKYVHELNDIQVELSELVTSEDSYLRNMAISMKTKFEKYYGDIHKMNKLLFMAVVLDPRYKLKYLAFVFGKIHEIEVANRLVQEVKESLFKLYSFYDDGDKDNCQSDRTSKNNTSTFNFEGSSKKMPKFKEKGFSKSELLFYQVEEDNNNSKDESELDQYLNEACEKKNEEFDILKWWKINSARFKILSQIARDILAIQVSTVASESAFSTGGRVLDPFRSSLRPKMVEALICSQNWLREADKSLMNDKEDEDLANMMDDLHIYDGLDTELFLDK